MTTRAGQVARYAEDTLGLWLDRAPEARFVVTTREVLGDVDVPGVRADVLLQGTRLAAAQGDLDLARARLDEAEALVARDGNPPDGPLGRLLETIRRELG